MQAARALVQREGLTVKTKDGGCRAHPCVKIESEARIAFCRCLRELDLDIDGPAAERTRPPVLRSIAR
jgi:hypothetical protein